MAVATGPGKGPVRILILDGEAVRAYITRIFTSCGFAEGDARIAAENLALADQSGHASHGIGLVPMYVDTVKAGNLSPAWKPEVVKDTPPFVVIDGHRSLGQVVALDATKRAIDIAREHGVAILNLIDAHHVGRIGHYGEMAAAAGMIGLFWVNVHGRKPTVVPFGAREPRFSTNPHCVAIPRQGGEPLLLDFATAEIAVNKARVYHAQGKKARFGALVDADGRPTDDPGVLFATPRGSLATFGHYKGSGLAIVCELMSSALGGGPLVSDETERGAILNNMLAIVIDPGRLSTSQRDVPTAVDELVRFVKSAAPAAGIDEVLVPGEPEQRARKGFGSRIEIDAETWAQITAAGARAGVPAAAAPSAIS